MLREERAVQALTEQLKYYGKGEGAWSALDGLARIAHASSVPIFTARLADRDAYVRRAAAEGLGRAGDKGAMSALETGAGNDPSNMVRAAMQYALQKLGRNYVARLVEFLGRNQHRAAGPGIPDRVRTADRARAAAQPAGTGSGDPRGCRRVLGAIGGDTSLQGAAGPQGSQQRGRRRRRARDRADQDAPACS